MDNEDRSKPLDQIDKIAELIRSLTYGEMIELASELRKSAGETEQISKLAELICSLTYGEMIELASELGKVAGETEITAETLPTILHRWANDQRKVDPRVACSRVPFPAEARAVRNRSTARKKLRLQPGREARNPHSRPRLAVRDGMRLCWEHDAPPGRCAQ